MKTNQSIFSVLGAMSLAFAGSFTSCTAPEEHAAELAKTYNEKLAGFEECTSTTSFSNKKWAADQSVKNKWEEFQEKYADDTASWNMFVRTYNESTSATKAAFKEAYEKSAKDLLEKEEYWFVYCPKNGFYLYSFKDGQMSIANSKSTFKYTQSYDSIFFDDSKNTVARVGEGSSDNLKLTAVGGGSAYFEPADYQTKLLGAWNWNFDGWPLTATFKPNGKLSLSIAGRTETSKYNINEEGLSIKGGKRSKYNYSDINTFKCDGQVFRRIVKKGPEDVTVMFENESLQQEVSSSSSSSSSSDIDAWLDDYEEFVTSYIKLAKKAQAGDLSAMSEYATMMEKAQSLQSKISGAQGQMSTSQLNRFNKIVSKMASAAY